MLKVMVVVSKKPGLSRTEFLRHWQELHPPLVSRLPGVRRYRQNVAIEHKKSWPFDGVAEISFDSLADIAKAFSGPEAKALFAHEEEFIGDLEWAIVEEHSVEMDTPADNE